MPAAGSNREAAPRPRGGPTPPAEGSVRSVVPGTHWGAWNLPPTDERGRSGEPSHVLRAAEPLLPRESEIRACPRVTRASLCGDAGGGLGGERSPRGCAAAPRRGGGTAQIF